MKLNIANPSNGAMKVVEIDDEKKLVQLYEKRMAQEVVGDVLGDEYKGYIFRITGGNDKQGFPMAQGILTDGRVRLLMAKGATHYRPRKTGERKRRSVRGCIVGADLAVLNLSIMKKGDAELPGLTDADAERPRRLGPKRAQKIRKLFNLAAGEDVRKYVVTRKFVTKKDKARSKRPKIQRLVTPLTLQHKRQMLSAQKRQRESVKAAKKEYEQMRTVRAKEEREARASAKLRRNSSRKASAKKEAPPAAA